METGLAELLIETIHEQMHSGSVLSINAFDLEVIIKYLDKKGLILTSHISGPITTLYGLKLDVRCDDKFPFVY